MLADSIYMMFKQYHVPIGYERALFLKALDDKGPKNISLVIILNHFATYELMNLHIQRLSSQ